MNRITKRGFAAGVASAAVIGMFPGVAYGAVDSREGYKDCPAGQAVVIFSIADGVHGTVRHSYDVKQPSRWNPYDQTFTFSGGIHQRTNTGLNHAWWLVTGITNDDPSTPIANVDVYCQ